MTEDRAHVAGPHGRTSDRQGIHEELERVRADFHHLVSNAAPADLRRATNGTRWTNQQMLWHMAFGYLIVQRLLSRSSACSDGSRPRSAEASQQR